MSSMPVPDVMLLWSDRVRCFVANTLLPAPDSIVQSLTSVIGCAFTYSDPRASELIAEGMSTDTHGSSLQSVNVPLSITPAQSIPAVTFGSGSDPSVAGSP